MGWKLKGIFLFVVCLFLLSFVSAVPPFQEETGSDKGLTLSRPPIDFLEHNRDFYLSTHVFNSSNDLLVTNETTSCWLHLYNSTGNHLLTSEMSWVNDDFEVSISGGNFSEIGLNSFLLNCNSSGEGGFISGEFQVNGIGREMSSSSAIFYLILFLTLMFLFFIVILGADKLPDSNERDEDGNVMKISYLKYLRPILWFTAWMFVVAILFITSNIAMAYLGERLFATFLFNMFKVSFSLTLPIILIWLIWIFSRIVDDKEISKFWERGMYK